MKKLILVTAILCGCNDYPKNYVGRSICIDAYGNVLSITLVEKGQQLTSRFGFAGPCKYIVGEDYSPHEEDEIKIPALLMPNRKTTKP